MSKPAKGTKRVCPSCGARFYDLNRTPVSCPLCQTVYQVPVASPRRNERAQPAEEKKPEEAKAPPVVERVKAVSPEEAEEAGVEADDVSDDEDIDLGDDAPEIPPSDDDDNTFLEDDEEEGEAEVSKIVPKSGEDS